jgi:hypothetical protein
MKKFITTLILLGVLLTPLIVYSSGGAIRGPWIVNSDGRIAPAVSGTALEMDSSSSFFGFGVGVSPIVITGFGGVSSAVLAGMNIQYTLTALENADVYAFNLAPGITEFGSGTHPLVAIMRVVGPTVTNAGAAVTNIASANFSGGVAGAGTVTASTLRVESPWSGATTNLSFNVVTGTSQFGGNVVSDTDNTDDFGTSTVAWANLFVRNVVLDGSTSGNMTLTGAATITDYTITWPAAQASGTQFLENNGSGTLSWTTVAAAAVTALNSATESELVTVGNTTTELDAESTLTFDGSTLALTGDMTISNGLAVSDGASTMEDNVAESTAVLALKNSTAASTDVLGISIASDDGAAGTDGDILKMNFIMDDDLQAQTIFGQIQSFIIDDTQGTLESEIRLFALDSSVLTEAAAFGWNLAGGFAFNIGTSLTAGVGGLGLQIVTGGLVSNDGASSITDNSGAGTPPLRINATTSTTSQAVLILSFDDAGVGVDDDEQYTEYRISNAAGADEEFCRLTVVARDTGSTDEDGAFLFSCRDTDTLTPILDIGFDAAGAFAWAMGAAAGSPVVAVTITQTFSTAEATHAARTAATLTDNSDGSATPDLTIDLIADIALSTGDTYTDAAVNTAVNALVDDTANAVEELAAELNDVIDDQLDTASVLNSVVDALQAHGILGT